MKSGVEYTFLTKNKNEALNFAAYIRENFPLAHEDGGILEVPSPPLRNLKQHYYFHKKLYSCMKFLGCPVKRSKRLPDGTLVVEGTGGGHIHVELPKGLSARNRVFKRLLNLVAAKPWIGWVFNEFGDIDQAEAFLYGDESHRIQDFLMYGRMPALSSLGGLKPDSILSNQLYILSGYGCNAMSLRPNYGTAEFRFFDAPTTWKQTREHLIFATRFVNYAKHLDKIRAPMLQCPIPRSESKRQVAKHFKRLYTRERVLAEFKTLTEAMGLKWRDYKKYMKNFDDRLAFSRLT